MDSTLSTPLESFEERDLYNKSLSLIAIRYPPR